MLDVTTINALAALEREIAGFQHRNESMHRHHDLGEPTCPYCDLVAHYAVKTMLRNRSLVLAAFGAESPDASPHNAPEAGDAGALVGPPTGAPVPDPEEPAKVVDLMAALEASLAAAKRSGADRRVEGEGSPE